MRWTSTFAGCTLLALGPICAPQAPDASNSSVHALERVAVIGASLSAGYRTSTNLQRVLDAVIERADVAIDSETSTMFFTDPFGVAEAQVDTAHAFEPTLVVAVDFLFWFGYGLTGEGGDLIRGDGQRVKGVEFALGLLDRLSCPMVVGDFGDMSPAAGRALLSGQLPSSTALERMNEMVRTWAKRRGDVVVLPIGDLLDDLRSAKPIEIAGRRFEPDETKGWMQRDRLHPTREGLIAVGLWIADELVRRRWASPEDLARSYELLDERVEATRRRNR